MSAALVAAVSATSIPGLERLHARDTPATPCASLKPTAPEGAAIASFTAIQQQGYCQIDTYVTHGTAGDNVRHGIFLPSPEKYNGRFMGNGGGGMSAGSPSMVPAGVSQGYASGATDAGLGNSFDGTSWANNTQLHKNFAHLSVHEFTVLGKDLAKQYYGKAPQFSYWNGCSQGGRQGYMAAQHWPNDYNGVYAASSAINWDRFQVALIWPYIVQNIEGEFVPLSVFNALTAAAIAACAGPDHFIEDPNACYSVFDATKASNNGSWTARQAKIWQMIAVGPVDTHGNKLWSGILPGASYATIAGSQPFSLAAAWVRNWILKQPNFDWKTLTYASFVDVFALGRASNLDGVNTDDPDLSAFQAAGGKLLSWHGWADSLIGANGTYDYRVQVEAKMGGAAKVDEFYRLWMVPGVEHCGGVGPTPTDPFGALVKWVEQGVAPEVLAASGGGQQRDLCRHPLHNKYKGEGAITAASSWGCAP